MLFYSKKEKTIMPYTYEQELEIFQRQWKMPKYDLKETAESADKLRYANAFLTGDSITIGSANQFIRWVSKTLSIYLETNEVYPQSFLQKCVPL